MDGTLGKIATCVKSRDTRLACAAAVVLAELAPREPSVVEALCAALPRADAARRPFLIEALGRTGTPRAAEALAPLIRAGGPSGEEALRAVAHAGAGMVKPLAPILGEAPPALVRQLAEAIARGGGAQGLGVLVSALRQAEGERVRALSEGLQSALPVLDAPARRTLRKNLTKALGTARFRAREAAGLAALELLGALRDPEALSVLMARADGKAGPRERRAALRAVGRLELSPTRRGRLAPKLLPLLNDPDFANRVEPALAALRGAEIGKEHRAVLQKLAHSQRPEVREFAMRALAAQGSGRNISELIACLEDPDRSVREDAAEALARVPEAAGPLAERFGKLKNAEAGRIAARVLTGMAGRIPEKTVRALAQNYVQYFSGKKNKAKAGGGADEEARRQAEQRRQALFAVCRASGRAALAETALKRARKLRAIGEAQAAWALLHSISGVVGWSAAHGVEQALAGLTIQPLDLSRAARARDENLRRIEDALREQGIPPKTLARAILKDRSLSRRAKYYVGHHGAEGLRELRDLGKEILTGLAANPRNEEGRQARDKLRIEGLAQTPKGKRTGLLEARAKVLMSAAEMAADARKEELRRERRLAEREARQHARSRKTARKKSAKKGKRPAAKKVAAKPTRKKVRGKPARKKSRAKPARKKAAKKH